MKYCKNLPFPLGTHFWSSLILFFPLLIRFLLSYFNLFLNLYFFFPMPISSWMSCVIPFFLFSCIFLVSFCTFLKIKWFFLEFIFISPSLILFYFPFFVIGYGSIFGMWIGIPVGFSTFIVQCSYENWVWLELELGASLTLQLVRGPPLDIGGWPPRLAVPRLGSHSAATETHPPG